MGTATPQYGSRINTDINVSVAYLSASTTRGITGPLSYKDHDLPRAPEWTVNAGPNQRFPLSALWLEGRYP